MINLNILSQLLMKFFENVIEIESAKLIRLINNFVNLNYF